MTRKIRTIIVDDEPPARLLIRTLLAEFSDIVIVDECSSGKAALKLIHEKRPDVVFLDVQMPGMSGVKLLTQLDSGFIPYIIFVTAYDQYAVRAFELEAIDYIVKPVKRDRLIMSLERARRQIARDKQTSFASKVSALAKQFTETGETKSGEINDLDIKHVDFIRIKEGRRIRDLSTKEIVYIKAANQYIEIHTTSDVFLLSKSLKEIESNLNPDSFVRIHRSLLVNSKFVSEVRSANFGAHIVLLSNGIKLRVSRKYSDKVTLLLNPPQ